MTEFTKQGLAVYEYPRIVHMFDGLPKAPANGIRRRALRGAPLEKSRR